jgi:hypothetical protein
MNDLIAFISKNTETHHFGIKLNLKSLLVKNLQSPTYAKVTAGRESVCVYFKDS